MTTNPQEIPDVAAVALPPGSVAPRYHADNVVDDDAVSAWATSWAAGEFEAEPCAATPGVGRLRLTWDSARRVDSVMILAGRDKDADDRPNQFRPRRVDFRIGDQCVPVSLQNETEWQEAKVSVNAKVTELTVSVGRVWPHQAKPPVPLVAIRGIRLRTKGD